MGNISHQTSPSPSSHQQSLFSNPLFSSIVTLYILILLYFPQIFIKTILSPILISTLILLLSLLRLGTSQQLKQVPPPQPINVINNTRAGASAPSHDQIQKEKQPLFLEHGLEPEPKPELNRVDLVLNQEKVELKEPQYNKAEAQLTLEANKNNDEAQLTKECLGRAEPKPAYSSNILLEWDVGAPLEVIYEAYEGEEGGEEVQNDEFWQNACCNDKQGKVEKYPSLSRYYPETDSDSDSDDEAERDGLIEVALDYGFGDKRIINLMMKVADQKKEKEKEKEEFYFDDHEEDNLIEIDISSTKNMYDFAW